MKQEKQNASNKAINAGVFLVSGRMAARVIDLVIAIVLTRLLTPEDFGLVALAIMIVMIAEAMTDVPIVQVLLRSGRLTKNALDTAFTLSLIRGALVSGVLMVLAVPFSHFFTEPRLVLLVLVTSLAPALRGARSPRMVFYMRQMNFMQEVIIELAGKAMSFIIAVGVAIATQSYWAIAIATVCTPLIMNILSYIIAPYRPRLTLVQWSEFSQIITWSSLSQVIQALNWQLDRFVLGRYIPAADFGRYTMAANLAEMPVRVLTSPLVQPLVVAFSKREKGLDLQRAYQNAFGLIFMLAAPVFVMLAFLSEPIIFVLLGRDWMPTAPILLWLSLIAMLNLQTGVFRAVALTVGRMKPVVISVAGDLVIKATLLLPAVAAYGIDGALPALAVSAVCLVCLISIFIKSLIGVPLLRQITTHTRTLIGLIVLIAVLLLLRPTIVTTSSWPTVTALAFIAGCAAGLSYVITIWLCWYIAGKPDGAEKIIMSRVLAIITRFKGAII